MAVMRSPSPRQWGGIVLAAVVFPGFAATAWPLVPFLWDLLPGYLPVARIITGAGLGVLALAAIALIWGFRLWWLIVVAWIAAITAVASMVFAAWLVLGTPGVEEVPRLSPRALDAITTRAFAVVAGFGGVALLVIAYRRQRAIENGERREAARLFTESFDGAGEKLGSEHASVRLAGVHALARLADEAPEEREDLVQMVIDVLCAYLRMPYSPAPDPLPGNASRERRREHRDLELEFSVLREVRHTVIRAIGGRLREPQSRWRGREYDFTGAVFDGGDLSGAVFSGGKTSFNGAVFVGGEVSFHNAVFSGGEVDFRGVLFSGGGVDFRRARFCGGRVSFRAAEFSAGWVDLRGCDVSDGWVSFDRARFAGGWVSFERARFSGGGASFSRACFSGDSVSFDRARFSRGWVSFGGAEFSEGCASFDGAEFSGGQVPFNGAVGVCPRGLREAVGQGGSDAVVGLPEAWRKAARDGGEGGEAFPGASSGG
ncbi:hypothetical protein GCM10009605_30520 [Nocardiopsis composta]